MSRHVVGLANELPPGTRKLVTVKGRAIAIFNVGGDYFALLNRCPHRGGSLCHGKITGLVQSQMPGEYEFLRAGEILRCPWHGWEFDIRTGKTVCVPEEIRTRSFPVAVASGQELSSAPEPSLEQFPISVEDDYVVVTLPEGGR